MQASNKIVCWQLNLHHCQAASYNLGKEIGKGQKGKETNIGLIQEP